MAKRKMTEFGKDIKRTLVNMDRSQAWLIEEVKEDTGLYFDDSYLYKILTGQLATPKIVSSICKILDMGDL